MLIGRNKGTALCTVKNILVKPRNVLSKPVKQRAKRESECCLISRPLHTSNTLLKSLPNKQKKTVPKTIRNM